MIINSKLKVTQTTDTNKLFYRVYDVDAVTQPITAQGSNYVVYHITEPDITALEEGLTLRVHKSLASSWPKDSGGAVKCIQINDLDPIALFWRYDSFAAWNNFNNVYMTITYTATARASASNYYGYTSQAGFILNFSYDSGNDTYSLTDYGPGKVGAEGLTQYSFTGYDENGNRIPIIQQNGTVGTIPFVYGRGVQYYDGGTKAANTEYGAWSGNFYTRRVGFVVLQALVAAHGLTTVDYNTKIYIKGTMSGTTITPIGLTKDLPNTEDGYVYMLLAKSYAKYTNTTGNEYWTMDIEHPIYEYKGGAIRQFGGDYVDLYSDQTVDGVKTFEDRPLVNTLYDEPLKLPEGYRKLEFLDKISYGTTGDIKILNNITSSSAIELKFQLYATNNMSNQDIVIFGKKINYWFCLSLRGTNLVFSYTTSSDNTEVATIIQEADLEPHIFAFKDNKVYFDNVYKFDAVLGSFYENETNLARIYSGSIPSWFRFYYCKIYENNSLITDFIPVYNPNLAKLKTNIYDKVSGKLYSELCSPYVYTSEPEEFVVHFNKDYQAVEYIESTGTQYINTGVSSGTSTLRAILDYTILSDSGAMGWVETKSDSTIQSQYSILPTSIEVGRQGVFDNLYTVNERNHLITSYNDYLYINSKIFIVSTAGSYGSHTGCAFHLFAREHVALDASWAVSSITVSDFISCRFYGGKFYDSEFNLIRYLIPCYRKSDNVIGLFDGVTQKFYTNEGTGVFLKGEDIDLNISSTFKVALITDLPSEFKSSCNIRESAKAWRVWTGETRALYCGQLLFEKGIAYNSVYDNAYLTHFANTFKDTSTNKTMNAVTYHPKGAIRYYSGPSIGPLTDIDPNDLWVACSDIRLEYSFNITQSVIRANADVYIRMKLTSGGWFEPVYRSGHPLVFNEISGDGNYYIYLGHTYKKEDDIIYLSLTINHDIYYRQNGQIRIYGGLNPSDIPSNINKYYTVNDMTDVDEVAPWDLHIGDVVQESSGDHLIYTYVKGDGGDEDWYLQNISNDGILREYHYYYDYDEDEYKYEYTETPLGGVEIVDLTNL